MEKSAEAFRTISEVADLLETPAHVLRFWESRFVQVKPVKRAGGRRYYRPADLALLGGIKKLLHEDGMTIRGVQKVLREQGARHVAALSGAAADAGTVAAGAPKAPPAERPGVAAGRPSPFGGPGATRPASPARWSAAPSPEVAEGGMSLLPDPEDTALPAAPGEAPMELDVPTLPLGRPDNVRPLAPDSAAPDSAAPARPGPAAEVPPAATMLRAMDALRARGKTTELRAVYLRLSDLRTRLAAARPD